MSFFLFDSNRIRVDNGSIPYLMCTEDIREGMRGERMPGRTLMDIKHEELFPGPGC